jgi:hypothetical protein
VGGMGAAAPSWVMVRVARAGEAGSSTGVGLDRCPDDRGARGGGSAAGEQLRAAA